ncbi:SRPBCC family protein [Candidatus Neptunichlamydia sp. REUL1]|uniref:SRPBCC family protein n=1 Tax=Candidatus Neptunichlamydia sp. REUL1 TaxID=3064277 RepID=UPI00292EB492|nr:SRPBCC family protein [Candidatus Neptunochlamydia sp. REUL1]
MKVAKEIIVEASPKDVYLAYSNLEAWKDVMQDVVAIKSYYDDSFHQEFDMTVSREGGEETVHSIRFCFPYHSVEIFQTRPPPKFKSMSGIWTFKPCSEGTLLTGERHFEIKERCEFNLEDLEMFLEKNLSSFKNWIEANAMCQC